MSHLKVTIDGDVVMDGDTGTWQQRQPEFVAEQLKAMTTGGKAPAPWMRALMLTIAEAAMTETYADISVLTSGSGWNLEVKYAIELGT